MITVLMGGSDSYKYLPEFHFEAPMSEETISQLCFNTQLHAS